MKASLLKGLLVSFLCVMTTIYADSADARAEGKGNNGNAGPASEGRGNTGNGNNGNGVGNTGPGNQGNDGSNGNAGGDRGGNNGGGNNGGGNNGGGNNGGGEGGRSEAEQPVSGLKCYAGVSAVEDFKLVRMKRDTEGLNLLERIFSHQNLAKDLLESEKASSPRFKTEVDDREFNQYGYSRRALRVILGEYNKSGENKLHEAEEMCFKWNSGRLQADFFHNYLESKTKRRHSVGVVCTLPSSEYQKVQICD